VSYLRLGSYDGQGGDVEFRQEPMFAKEWPSPYRKHEHGPLVLLGISNHGVLFAEDDDPEWGTFSALPEKPPFYYRQVLVPWANIAYIGAKHAT
jgi:hypothetical protein